MTGVAVWQVWRDGASAGAFDDRVAALAHALTLRVAGAGEVRVDGPGEPACRTNRDLYNRLVGDGERMRAAGRGLEEFLRAWWRVGRELAGRERLDLDDIAAMVAAAAAIEAPPPDPAWRTADLRPAEADADEPETFRDWEAVVLSQIADLADFAERAPVDDQAVFGVDAPRADGCRRATGGRWYNFDPMSYLECGMAGTLGGWSEEDGIRVPVPAPVVDLVRLAPEPGGWPVDVVEWGDLADLARCGQDYE
ncbi:hypothetical protein [Dactylosporangium sp. CA-092794]|uniref:hypothetical protein n=1 Tax=Dactylosporangium sp. CA-092794 TaxID=3239929 RepID=UPI003D8D7BDD